MFISEEYLDNIDKQYCIGKSSIDGNGAICVKFISMGSLIDKAILPNDNGVHIPLRGDKYKTTLFGKHINHSYEPNAETRFEVGTYNTYAIKDILPGDEITVDYTVNKELEQPKSYFV